MPYSDRRFLMSNVTLFVSDEIAGAGRLRQNFDEVSWPHEYISQLSTKLKQIGKMDESTICPRRPMQHLAPRCHKYFLPLAIICPLNIHWHSPSFHAIIVEQHMSIMTLNRFINQQPIIRIPISFHENQTIRIHQWLSCFSIPPKVSNIIVRNTQKDCIQCVFIVNHRAHGKQCPSFTPSLSSL